MRPLPDRSGRCSPPVAGRVRFLFHASRKVGCSYRTVSRASPPKSIDVHECGVDPTTRTFVSEGTSRNPPRTGHGRYESNLGRWSRTRLCGRGAAARQPVRPPVVRGVRDATGPPRGNVRRDGEHGSREYPPERTVGMDRLPMARGLGVPRHRDRGRGPQDTSHRDIGDRHLAPLRGPPRGGAALSEPAGIEWQRVGELRLRIRGRRARLCPHRGGRPLASPGACAVRGADYCRMGSDIDPRFGLRITWRMLSAEPRRVVTAAILRFYGSTQWARRDAMNPISAANPRRYAHPMTISDVGIVMSPK